MTGINSFFVATGTNMGDRRQNLEEAKSILQKEFHLIAESRIYESPAVDYLSQPDFYNQVLEFSIPSISAEKTMERLLEIEKEMGRNRTVPKGPRVIDLDILFWSNSQIQTESLIIPHPRLFERSFVVLPMSELPGFKELQKQFHFKFTFANKAFPL